MEIPFFTPSGEGYSLPLSAQRTVNLYPVMVNGRLALYGTPGCTAWATCGVGPVRGALSFGGVGYVVSGSGFYSVSASGTPTLRGSLDTVSGTVTMATNGLQVIVADGTSTCDYMDGYGILTPGGQFWIYDIAAATWEELELPDNPGAESFYITSLIDFTEVDALDFASAEAAPDDLIRVFADHGDLLLFGSQSIEPWQNTGAADFPFERQGSTRIERGLASRYAVAKCDNSVFFLGDDLVPYRLNGYDPARIGTEQVEFSIGRMSRTDDAFAFTYDQEGHKFWALTFPTAGITWVYDVATGLWHERSSNFGAWRASAYMKLGSRHLIGDSSSGKLLELRTDVYDEDGDLLRASHVLPPVFDDMSRIAHHRFELIVETGVGLENGDDPQIVLDWSNDGGRTYSNQLQRSAGKVGEYERRAIWLRLGTSIVRHYRIHISDPVKRVLIGASVDMSPGGK